MATRRASGPILAATALCVLGTCERARAGSGDPRPAAEPVGRQARLTRAEPALAVATLRCEHHDEPLALETPTPRFSWKLVAIDPERRGLAQSAYRVRVGSSPEALAAGNGDLWDSGRVASRETVDVAYGGRALASFERAHWQVQVWDQDGTPSAWSAPARFGMGVLAPEDWRAQWIGFDAPLRAMRAVPDLGEARWIGAPGGERELWLRRRFELATAGEAQAVLIAAAADECELFLNGQSVLKSGATPGVRRNADLVKVARVLVRGTNVLAARVRTTAETPAALACRLLQRPEARAGQDPGEVLSDGEWRASPHAAEGWEAPGFDDSAWAPAAPIEAEAAWLPEVDPPAAFLPPPRLLRTEFETAAQPVRATLYASALGVYSLELNGAGAHDDWLAPGWTDYTRRIPYRAYDVTALVRPGANALGVVLADGWYAGFLGKRGQRNHYGDAARFLGQLVLDYPDGTRAIVASDAAWRAAIGPWREADLYMGERYDARLEQRGWSAPGFEDVKWQPVDVGAPVAAPLVAHPGPAIRVVAELEPVAVLERGEGRALFDLGQNLAGVARLTLEAPAGTALLLRFAEALEADGSLMRRNLSWARATDQYVCRGGGPETWQPRFTYHGFRYVEVSGLPGPPAGVRLTALALSSATRAAGEFRCSDELVNALVESARWTLRANSMDVPTDCPQRGERLGWTGDAQLFAPSALWLADLETLYDKWSLDLLDAQRPDGRFPATAPSFPGMANGGPAWEDAGVLVPARLFEVHGDRRLAERHLESMRRFVAAVDALRGPDGSPPEAIEGYGDWHHLGDATPKEVLHLAYLARSARRTAELARALGRAEVAEPMEQVAERVRQSFAALLVDGEGRVRGGTQTAYALALREDLVPDALRVRAARHLLADLVAHGGLTTGFVGTAELLPALSELGRGDVARRLLASRTFPSWGYMHAQGATTVWEQWDSFTPQGGFAKNGRSSLNHTPLAAFVTWLFEGVAGIRPAEPGFGSVALAPDPGVGLAWAETSYDSVRGRIGLRWELAGEELRVAVELPPNVSGTLALEVDGPLLESGRPLEESPGARELARLGPRLLLALGPGRYAFSGSHAGR